MTRFAVLALFIACAGQTLSMQATLLRAEEPKKPLVPTIKEIMREAHLCRTAYIRDVRSEIEKEQPDWERVEARSRDLVRVGKLLALNIPPRGATESWEKLTGLYIARATVLVEAAEQKDREEGRVVARRLQSMCASCHREHKGPLNEGPGQ